MPKLLVRFAGLCLHRNASQPTAEVDILHAWPTHGQKSRDGHHLLTDHRPQLWIEGDVVTDRHGVQQELCLVTSKAKAACREVWIFDLLPAEILSLVGGTNTLIDWAGFKSTSLRKRHTEISTIRKRPPAPSVTRFAISSGRWSSGPAFDVEWQPSGDKESLALWQELEIDFPAGNTVKIDSAQGGWELTSLAADRIVWVTSYPMDPGHHSGHANSLATHFTWLYECVEFNAFPTSLEFPKLLEALPECAPQCGAGGPTNTVFCPDGQYP